MPKSTKDTPTKQQRQRAKRGQAALRMMRKSLEQLVRLAYAKIPKEAVALNQARLEIQASPVSRGLLTIEDLESLAKQEAITTATQHIIEQIGSTPTGKHRKRA
jgi:hypothetical protein